MLAAQKSAGSAGWSVWPLLLGAALTLATTLIVQTYVVPRVESGKRRADRWERDVLALGELLTFEYSAAADSLVTAVQKKILLDTDWATDWATDADPQKLADLRFDFVREMRGAGDEHRRVTMRADWLGDRVEAIGKRSADVPEFRRLMWRLRAAYLELGRLEYAAEKEPDTPDYPTLDALEEVEAKHSEALRALVNNVKALAGRPPRQSPFGMLRRRWPSREAKRSAP